MINDKNKLNDYVFTCPHCGKMLDSWFRGNIRGKYLYKDAKQNKFRYHCFCTQKCYDSYKENFIVEIYNNQPIYCVEIDEKKRYMPYFEASYYFTNINDCKERMDSKNISILLIGQIDKI